MDKKQRWFEKLQPWGTWRDVSEGYKVVCKIKEVENNTRVILCDFLNKRKLWKKGLKAAHKYFAFGSLICMIMAVYSGHKMISGNKSTRKQVENTKVEE